MKNTFVPLEIAKQLKELGFSEPCLAWWFEGGTVSVPTEGRTFWSDWNVNPLRISARFGNRLPSGSEINTILT